jgi:tetratricopeptide (TPR) repeat protein
MLPRRDSMGNFMPIPLLSRVRAVRFYRRLWSRFIKTAWCISWLLYAHLPQADTGGAATGPGKISREWEAVDLAYQEFSDRWFSLSVKKNPPAKVANLGDLAAQVHLASPPQGVALIRANIDLVRAHVTKPEFEELLAYLYEMNDTATVQLLTDHLKKTGGSALSYNYFLLAQYYEQRQNWQAVQGALSKINIRDLRTGDAHYYQLLMGYALQNLKDHRKSVQYYQQIPSSSPYFAHAKLNEGTANLRQGWWTEAHLEFERAIQFLTEHPRDEDLRNRLLVVLGYSQLHYEFYRDARNTLRKVAVNSSSSNKALMGIGLAAAYQKDFAGAANAFRLLAEKPTSDLSVDEAFLLLPYAQEETGNKEAAGLAYQKAIDHYQRKLEQLHRLQDGILTANQNNLLKGVEDAEVRSAEIFGGSAAVPGYLQKNFANLLQMPPLPGETDLEKAAQDLRQRYQTYLRDTIAHNIEARRAMLDSYLSQAKFGMAKLYDTP